MNKCTKCGNDFSGFRINIEFYISPERQKLNGLDWEQLQNLTVNTREILCKECFDKYVAKIGELNDTNNRE